MCPTADGTVKKSVRPLIGEIPSLTVGVLCQPLTNPDRQGGDPRADIFSQSRERRVAVTSSIVEVADY